MRADSATVASVWLRNTTTVISINEAASTDIGASNPSVARRRWMVWAMALAPVSRAAMAINPCGAGVAVSIAAMIATAAGASRRVPIALSTSTQVTTTPRAISGSGREPLVYGRPASTDTAAAVHTATRWAANPPFAGPNRRNTQWLMSSQQVIPASVAGSRIHTPAVLTDASFDSTDRYQSYGASVVPKYR